MSDSPSTLFDPQDVACISSRQGLADEVFALIRSAIISGRIAPGQWLRQIELAHQLGVSQMPVRQALERLVAEGLAEHSLHRGVRVLELPNEELLDVCILRRLMEGPVIRMAVDHITEPQLATLRDVQADASRLVQAGVGALKSFAQPRRNNDRFHTTIARSCGGRTLVRVYEQIVAAQPVWGLYEHLLVSDPNEMQRSLEDELSDHNAILSALTARDVSAAEQAAMKHVEANALGLIRVLGFSDELVSSREKALRPSTEWMLRGR